MSTSRTRSWSTYQPTRRVYVSSDRGRISGDNNITGTAGSMSSISDNKNSAFRVIRDAGGIVLSDCVISKSSRSFSSGHIYATSNPGYDWTGDMTGDLASMIVGMPTLPVSYMEPHDVMGLFMKAYAKINESDILTGELLSDLGKTVGMLKHPFKSATTLLWKIEKRRRKLEKQRSVSQVIATGLKKVHKVSSPASQAWLEYRYGWKPIILDTIKIIKEVGKKRDNLDKLRLVSRAGSKRERKRSGSWPATATISCSGAYTDSLRTRVDVGVIYDVKNRETSDQLMGFLGIRPRDILPTVWEIIPFSFVIDWFVGIGDWLQAISPAPGVSIRGWWCTQISDDSYTRSGGYAYFTPPASNAWKGSFGSESVTNFSMTRIVNQPLTFTPTVRGFNTISRLHQIDALALLNKPITAMLGKLRH